MFRILCEDEVRQALEAADSYRAMEDAYSEFGRFPEVLSRPPLMAIEGARPTLGRQAFGQYRLKGASSISCRAAGALLYTRKHPYIYLWSSEDDAPIGLIASNWLTQLRVALSAVITIKLLAAPQISAITLFGAGKFSYETCRLLAQTWPHVSISVFASQTNHAEAFAEKMPGNVRAGVDVALAIGQSDVIVTLTNATAPFISGGLKAGALLLSMGGVQEAEAAVFSEIDGLIVDDLAYARLQGNLAAWLRNREITEATMVEKLRANIGEILMSVKPGRRGASEKILAIVQGLTVCDIALAKIALDRAAVMGIGRAMAL